MAAPPSLCRPLVRCDPAAGESWNGVWQRMLAVRYVVETISLTPIPSSFSSPCLFVSSSLLPFAPSTPRPSSPHPLIALFLCSIFLVFSNYSTSPSLFLVKILYWFLSRNAQKGESVLYCVSFDTRLLRFYCEHSRSLCFASGAVCALLQRLCRGSHSEVRPSACISLLCILISIIFY